MATMIIYLMHEYHMEAAAAASIIFTWQALANILPMFGAYVSDSYLGRFRTIVLASFSCVMGTAMVWLTTMLPGLRPPACELTSSCQSATLPQLAMLFSAFLLISLGSAGIRPCAIAFGADQFTIQNPSKREKTLQAYFNAYYASVGIALIVAFTVIVYIVDRHGWKVGFGVPVGLTALSASLLLLASPLYIKVDSKSNILLGFAQVIVAAIRNRNLDLSKESLVVLRYHYEKSSLNMMVPSDKLRFFNKACLVKNPEEELGIDGVAKNPWRLCTVEQVEDLKSIIRVLPLWSSGFMLGLTMNQTFSVLQAETMDRHIGPNFELPAASISVFIFITLSLWSSCYDPFIFPLIVRITKNPTGLSLKQRMGIGLLLSILATAVATAVEIVRRRTAIKEGFPAIMSMSAMWLVPQNGLVGLAEAFNVIGQVEFFYDQLPKSMHSFAMALWTLGFGVANMTGIVLVKMIDGITGGDGRVSWLTSDLNKGHYEYYYLILTLMGVANFFYFLVCCWAYGNDADEGKKKTRTAKGEGGEENIP
ncbi:protein NRT1/ PTR FAMILY 1.2 [Canna indica]|uniref:Protein NRT1/ PTR FAMILY 1.2 n=1 Tax=Canna indica TaxID=4628 RepID=A0AAQ3QGL7_9LILI|nr:protein NRT1/ PTR FAMILY 1.2 [Canna indica]